MADTTISPESSYMYWDTLNFIPVEQKDKYWMAQALYFSKQNALQFVDPARAKAADNLEHMIINESEYKKLIDPITPDGKGGEAKYFSTDWKACPVFVHLNNIMDEDIVTTPMNAYVKAADEFTKDRKQKINDQIVSAKYLRAFINETNKQLNFPPLAEGENPYRYAMNMQPPGSPERKALQPVGEIDSIISAIKDDEGLAIFNEYIYKDGVEIAFELGMDYYLKNNKWNEILQKIARDQRNHNAHILHYYTSKTTGQPVIRYMEPTSVWVSPLNKQSNLDELVFVITETWETYGDFVRMFGAEIKKECEANGTSYEETMKQIFEMNRTINGVDSMPTWDKCSSIQRNATKIKVGYFTMETQDMDVYSDRTIRGNNRFRKEKSDYYPSKDSQKRYGAERIESHYNCWYECWYIPVSAASDVLLQTTDFEKQAKFMFGFGKVQDQQREGADDRYVRKNFIGYRSDKVSYYDVMNAFMPKINIVWQHFQNNLSNVMPEGLVFAEEIISQMMDATDDANKNGQDSKYETMRMLKQTGYGITKFFDSNGNLINNGQPFANVKTGHLRTAAECLALIQNLYNMMTQALGISDIREGQDPRPRQSLGAIQLSFNQSNKSTAFIERPITASFITTNWRILYWMWELVQSGDTYRQRMLSSQIGLANFMSLESIKDVPIHWLALTVENIMTDQEKQRLMAITDKMAAAGMVDPETSVFISRVDNLKYAEAILRLRTKKQKAENAQMAKTQHDYTMEELNGQLQIELAKIKQKGINELQDTELEQRWNMMIQQASDRNKHASQTDQIDKRGQNKNQQELLKADLEQKKALEQPLQEVTT